MDTEYGEAPAICHVCGKWDKNENMVTTTVTLQEVTWAGSAHLNCKIKVFCLSWIQTKTCWVV